MLSTACEPDELIIAVRFPVARSRGAAFREVSRRHGDFAIIAVAAMMDGPDDDTARRRRHGGEAAGAARPGRRRRQGCDRASWPSELEGYEDLHASAAMRRDILRHLAPVVIAEAQKCAA